MERSLFFVESGGSRIPGGNLGDRNSITPSLFVLASTQMVLRIKTLLLPKGATVSNPSFRNIDVVPNQSA